MHSFLSFVFLEYMIYYDVAAIFLFAFLTISVFLRRMNKAKSSNLFLILLLICFLATFFDLLSAIYSNNYRVLNISSIDHNFYISYLLHIIHFSLRYFIIFFYTIYVIGLTKTFNQIRKSTIYIFMLYVPIIILQSLIFSTFFTHFIFEFKLSPAGDLIYTPGKLIPMLTFFDVYYLVFILIHLIRNKRVFKWPQFFSMISIIPLTILAIILRFINQESLNEMIIVSLAFLIIVQNVESPELIIDSKTGLPSLNQFKIDVYRIFSYKDKDYVLLIKMVNYNEIFNKFNFDGANTYIKQFSNALEQIDKKNEFYSLDDGVFAVVYNSKSKAQNIAEMIRNEISVVKLNNIDFSPELSITIIQCIKDFESEEKFLKFADEYHNNNEIGIFEYSNIKEQDDYFVKTNIDEIVETAIKFDYFNVHYQPIYNVKEKKFTCAEALVRIESPKYGTILPDLFIPYAETKGVITQIDLIVIEKVMRFISEINLKNYGIDLVTINLSVSDFNNPSFVENVLRLKTKYNIEPNYINFEITESKPFVYDDILFTRINILQDSGFEFILDDYGTGYSNLEKFAKFPIRYVKLDRNLVKLTKSEQMRNAIKSTFKMIHELNRKTVIEGIETESEFNDFLKFDCSFIQGFYFSKALPESNFIEFLEKYN